MSNVMNAIIASTNNDADVQESRLVYDPNMNSHAFNHGFDPGWWHAMMGSRNGGRSGVRETFTDDILDLMKDAGGYWDVRKGQTSTTFEDGEILLSNPPTFNLHRADNGMLLQSGVGKNSPITPYHKIVTLPDDVGISFEDFLLDESADMSKMSQNEKDIYEKEIVAARERSNRVKAFMQNNGVDISDFDRKDMMIPLNKIMKPAGCNVWQGGKKITVQYFLGSFNPRSGDKHNVYFTIESSLDGTKATRYYLTIVRVVCENTQMHAEAEGWSQLLNVQKDRQRIRRTANFEKNLGAWRKRIVETIIGVVEVLDTFTVLAQQKIAENKTQRDAIVRAFVSDAFNIKADAKTKRSSNRLNEILNAVYMDDLGGGKECETWFDLLNGLTNYKQNFSSVNGLDALEDKLEKRYMLNLTDDGTIKENQEMFVKLMTRASVIAA